jgi:hypothetical protein
VTGPDRPDVREQVRAFVLELNPGLDPADLTDRTPLLARRLITSRHILDLLLLIEDLRRAPVDPASLVPHSFADIDSIVATVRQPAGRS